MPRIKDRLEKIICLIEKWKENDPFLTNKQGFLEFIKEQKIGQYKVHKIKVWLSYKKEARKNNSTIFRYFTNY